MKAEIRQHNGTPTLFLDGDPVFAHFHWLTSHPAPDKLENRIAIQQFAKAGIHLIAFDIGTGMEWIGPGPGREGHFDFSAVEGQYLKMLDADPDALFHLRIYLETREWWNELYPGECEVTDDDARQNQSYASMVWRTQVKDFLRAYSDHLRRIGLMDRVIGYQVEAGVCGEWIKNVSSMGRLCGDFSEPMRWRFREWLLAQYDGDVKALREAWRNPGVAFETADVPSGDTQRATTHMHFRDPAVERPVVDYLTNLADLSAELVIEFCRTAKEASEGNAIAGAFFGYLTEISWNDAFFGSPAVESRWSTYQRSGHLGLKAVLESPEVDFIVSPYSYAFRGVGGDGLPMPPSESLRRSGKLYIFEEDSRMHNRFDPDGRNYSFEHATAIHQRNFAQVLTHGLGVWWFIDNPPGEYLEWQKSEPEFQPWLERFQAIGTWALTLDRKPQAEVAVLLDDESMLYEEFQNTLSIPLIWHQRHQGLARFGAPYDIYLLQDLIDGRLPPYKLYIFLNAFHLDRSRRNALSREIKRDGRVALWIYAPGYAAGELSTDTMTDLTGFAFERSEIPWGPFMHVTHFTHPATAKVPQDLFWGTNGIIGPLFHLKDPDARILGQVVCALGRCKPGLGVKEFADWTSIYCAAPNIPAPVLRGIAGYAGVHIYNEAGDVLNATGDLLAVHTVSGGKREYRLPFSVEVIYDLYADRMVSQNADRFEVELDPISSGLWYTGPVAALEAFHRIKWAV